MTNLASLIVDANTVQKHPGSLKVNEFPQWLSDSVQSRGVAILPL